MPLVLYSLAAGALGMVFAWSALAKAFRPRTWRAVLAGYRLPGAPLIAVAVPLVELGVPVLVGLGRSRPAAALALVSLAGFSAAIVRARAVQGDALPCGCFGGAERRDYRVLLARNASLALLASFVLAKGRDLEPLEGLGAPDASEAVPVVLVIAGLSVIVWMFRSVRGSFSDSDRGGR